MRHSKASTTTDVYMQSLEPEVRSTINSIHQELMGKRKMPKASKTAKAPANGKKNAVGRETPRGMLLGFATRMRQVAEGR